MANESVISLEKALEVASTLHERIDVLNELAMQLLNTDIHRVIRLAEEARRLSLSLNQSHSQNTTENTTKGYQRGIAVANLALGAAYYRQANNELALSLSKEAVALCEDLGELRYMTFGLNTIGATYITIGEYNKALETHLKSLSIRQSIGDEHGAATSLMNVGNVYYLLGDYDRALDHYLQSLDLRKRIGDTTGIGTSLANIGNVYSGIGDSEQALDYLLQSADIKEKTGNKHGLGQTFCDIAEEYLKRKHREETEEKELQSTDDATLHSALEYARKSYDVSLEIGNTLGQAAALFTIAHIEELSGNTEEALNFYQQSLDIRRSIEFHKGESETLLAIGKLRCKDKAYKEASPSLNTALSLAESLQSKPLMYQAHFALAECCEHLGCYADALYHHKRFHSIKEQIFNEDSARKTKNLQLLHSLETAQHEAEIYRLRTVELSAANNEILRQQHILEEQAEELQRSNKELMNLNREKDDMLGIVAHDLKNPLTGILLHTSNICRNISRMKTDDILCEMKRIEDTAKRMHQITLNLLDVHAIESQALRLVLQPVSIGECFGAVVEEFAPRAAAKHIALHVTMDNPAAQVYADHNAFMQIMENLLSNAIKYSPQHKSVFLRCMSLPGDIIHIEIEDEGPGIPANEKEKLFKKYSKLSARPTAGEDSTGLGLSIVKKLAEAMKGRTWCEDAAIQGAVFVVELPGVRLPQYVLVHRPVLTAYEQ